MKLRRIDTKATVEANQFNVDSMEEIIVHNPDGSSNCDYVRNYEVFIQRTGRWMKLDEAIKREHIIPDKSNTYFAEPKNGIDRARGYFV